MPRWVVCGAGTGGTSATIGRYIRYRRLDTRLCVVDPGELGVLRLLSYGDATSPRTGRRGSRGSVGRASSPPSSPSVVDRMMRVPDAASFAAMRFLHATFGRRYGGSTGTNLYGALRIVAEMHERGQEGSVVTLICDSGDRYADTYYSDDWLRRTASTSAPHLETLERFYQTGEWREP